MNNVAIALLALTVVSAAWAVVASLAMASWLSRHGVRVNWILIRLFLPGYVHRYRKMTREIDGHAGPLFLHFVVPINLALLFAVAATIVLVSGGR